MVELASIMGHITKRYNRHERHSHPNGAEGEVEYKCRHTNRPADFTIDCEVINIIAKACLWCAPLYNFLQPIEEWKHHERMVDELVQKLAEIGLALNLGKSSWMCDMHSWTD